MRKSALAVVMLVAHPLLGVAQSLEGSWDNLKQLHKGQKVEVVDMKLKSLEGNFIGYSEDAVSLSLRGNEVSIPRARVLSVKYRGRSHRVRNVLAGLAIGAGGGLAIGAVKGATYHEEGETGVFVLVWTPIGAGIGAIAGAAIPTARPVTVYRASTMSR